LDTGVRAAEACGLLVHDIDLQARRAVIRRSEGGDRREVSFGATCACRLWALLKTLDCADDAHVFMTERAP
jgi:integrase